MASVFKMDPVMATLPQASLAKINLDVYPNARKEQAENYEARVEGMRNSISIDGLIAPPCLAVYGEGFAAVAGFTRLLALLQLAIKPLADAANKLEDGTTKKSDDPTFININKAADRKRLRDLDPAAYDKVLMETTVPYTPKTVENKQEARIINGIENLVRNDMSPRETANMFLEILTDKESPVKAKSLAKRFDMSEGKISQYRKMAEFERSLPEFLSTPQEGEKFTEDQIAQLKTTVNTLMTDYLNRLSMNPTKEEKKNKEAGQAIMFQHAREFINRIQPAANKTPLSRAVALTVFKKLLGWNETTGTLPEDRETPDFNMFCQQIDNAVKAAGQAEAAAADATATGTAPAGVDTAAVTGANPAAVHAAGAAGTVGGAVPAASSPAVTQTPVTTSLGAPVGTPIGAAGQAEAAVANALAGEEDEETNMDDILDQGGDIAGAAPDGTPGTRQQKAGVTPVTKSKYEKAKQHNEMDRYCDILLGLAQQDSNRLCDTAHFLGSMSGIYESLGMTDEQKEIDTAFDGYSDAVQTYVEKLEEVLEYAKKAGLPIKGMNLKELVRPTFVVESEEETVPASV